MRMSVPGLVRLEINVSLTVCSGYVCVCISVCGMYLCVGGRKDKESEQEKQRAQRIVARERVLMNMKRYPFYIM